MKKQARTLAGVASAVQLALAVGLLAFYKWDVPWLLYAAVGIVGLLAASRPSLRGLALLLYGGCAGLPTLMLFLLGLQTVAKLIRGEGFAGIWNLTHLFVLLLTACSLVNAVAFSSHDEEEGIRQPRRPPIRVDRLRTRTAWIVGVAGFLFGVSLGLVHARSQGKPAQVLPEPSALGIVMALLALVIIGVMSFVVCTAAAAMILNPLTERGSLKSSTADILFIGFVSLLSGYFGGLAAARSLGWH